MIARLLPGRRARDVAVQERVPYCSHLTGSVVSTASGDCLQMFHIRGVPFEAVDDIQINAWHERLNALLRNIAAPQVALWVHLIRDRADLSCAVAAGDGFAERLRGRYSRRLMEERLRTTELLLTVLYRPTAGLPGSALAGLLRRSTDTDRARLEEALEASEKLRAAVLAGLERYEPRLLGVCKAGPQLRSEILEMLNLLISGERRPVPLPRGPLASALGSSRIVIGSEVAEYRSVSSSRFGAVLGIKEYPTPTVPGMLNALLSAPMSLVLTQSFTFLSKAAAMGILQRQHSRMRNVGDLAVSQAEALTAALDELASNEFVMGDHHLSLQVLTDPIPAGQSSVASLAELHQQVAKASSLLTDVGITTAREDLALEAALWAQLPGNWSFRPRKAPISSRNFAALAPWHNYPSGRATGNQWGDAAAVFLNRARTPFYFSLHTSDRQAADGGSRTDTGHTFICGPTGSGKTVFVGFLIALFSARQVAQVIFDKDRGLEILIRALGGRYLRLANGQPTGCNPLRLEPTPHNVEFLRLWLRLLLRRDGEATRSESGISAREEADLDQALKGTLALEPAERRLSRLIEFLDPTAADGPYARLAPWCDSQEGERAWVFDNPDDTLAPSIDARSLAAFDVTDFLDHPLIRGPVTLYLFHLIREQLDGRPFICWLDEFGRLLADPAFRRFAQEAPNSWRKLNAVLCVATQSAREVLESPISRSLVEQTPTKIFFPNPDAAQQDYVDGFNLSEREFQLIRQQLSPGSRQFLVKQGADSVVCELDLKGFAAELAVISGRAQTVRAVEELITRLGEAPQHWLPEFLKAFGLSQEQS